MQRLRQELTARKRATVRFETAPGYQLQIDFGDTKVWIGRGRVRVHLFFCTLGYSRPMYIRVLLRERQADWFEGMEGAFLRFGGVPAEVLMVILKRWWSITTRPHARCLSMDGCMPLSATGASHREPAHPIGRTKGKDERGVGYVRRNAIAGRFVEEAGALRPLAGRAVGAVAGSGAQGLGRLRD